MTNGSFYSGQKTPGRPLALKSEPGPPWPPKVRFATDSTLEGDGFEISVPGRETVKPSWEAERSRSGSGSVGEPKVRIHLPPAGSPLRTWRRRHGLREQRPQGTCSSSVSAVRWQFGRKGESSLALARVSIHL